MDASLKASFNSMQLSPTATAGHSATDAYSHSPAEECKDRRASPSSGAAGKEKKAKKALSGGSLGGGVRVACCARGMPKSHNNRNAFLLIPPDVRHGDALPCSFPSCRAIGSKFRYCSYCEKPVAKRNFRNRHAHGSLMSTDRKRATACFQSFSASTAPTEDALLPGLCTEQLLMDLEDQEEVNTASAVSRTHWNICSDHVPVLPPFYPLDRNAIFVFQLSASDIAERIRLTLHERSIDATFHPEIALAKCVSKANVDFRVKLYRGRGDFRHGFIIEVQRRDGFDLSYQMDAIAILHSAAQGGAVDAG